ncbi:MFS family permease [Thermocatellispora tengchongensis]|uniref:MFS family permease n=1 Tax=Thermocatellispora tengchongensis TaxID=1073253 RepID=A0A840P6D9_9ACTN|nr:MFS transporter [Thermocatellispora tengchongensis]MBB5131575.1 MFS family permease [Thermocatellispora tengchongensis]
MSATSVPRTSPSRREALAPSAAIAMFGLLLLAYAVNAMDRMVFPVLLVEVRTEYGFSLEAAGLQATVFALGMGLAGIPAGRVERMLGRKWTIVGGTLLFSAATAMTAASAGFADMLLWRVLSGVGEALQLAAIITVASSAFPARRGVAIGSINMAFAAGSLLGPALGSSLLESHGTWRSPMLVFGAIGVVLALAVVLLVSRRLTEAEPAKSAALHVGGAPTLWSRNPLLLAAIITLFGLADFAFIGLYASYLREHLHFGSGQAGFVVGLSGLAAFASPAGGYLVDRWSPRLVLPMLNLGVAACGCALFLGPGSVTWQAVFSFLFGLLASSGVYVAAAGYLVKSVDARGVSRAAGVFVTCVYIAASVAGLMFSSLIAATGWTVAAMVQIVGFSVLGAALALVLRPDLFSTTDTTRDH